MSAPLWIKTSADIDALVTSLKGTKALSIDTEADGLHHYPVKLCLVQIADDRGRGHLADPLALPTLNPLASFFADPGVIKVLHAADNDLGYLKRLYGFTVENLFDTAIAARFLGVTSLSLDGLLRDFLGVDPGPSRQKDDWSKRPLSKAQETYALNDVLHLIPLRERLLEALRAKGRDLWVEEECAAGAAMPAPERVIDPDAYMRLKGAKDLDARGQGRPATVHDPGQRGPRGPGRSQAARHRRHHDREGLHAARRPPDGRGHPRRGGAGTRRVGGRAARPPTESASAYSRRGAAPQRGAPGVAGRGGQARGARSRRHLPAATHRSARPRPADQCGGSRAGRRRRTLARRALRR